MTATGDPADVVVPPPARHVVLIGLMGSGKTTVGRRLARLLDRGFVDADDALDEIADRSIADIFGSDGEAAFRAMEADVQIGRAHVCTPVNNANLVCRLLLGKKNQ